MKLRISLYGCLKTIIMSTCVISLALAVSRQIAEPAEADGATAAPPNCADPSLRIRESGAYWAGLAEYQLRLLTVSYTVDNLGGEDTGGIWIAGSLSNNGVTQTSSPYSVESVLLGKSRTFSLQYRVPQGVQTFRSTVYATILDECGEVHEIPAPMPKDGSFTTWQWARPAPTWIGGDGLHVYGGTTNRFKNPWMTDAGRDGVADGWLMANASNSHALAFGVESPPDTGAGEQVIVLRGTGAPSATDWFGLWMRHSDPHTRWALGAEVKLEWLPGTTQQEKDALTDLSVAATGFGFSPRIVLGKEEIGAGWRRVYTNSMEYPASREFYTQLRCHTSTRGWSSAGGGLEVRFRRPQLENTLTEKGLAYTTPAAMPSEPGVFLNGNGEPARHTGYAQIGTVSNGPQDDSVFRLDGSKDWGLFVQWQTLQDAREIIANDSGWQMINLNNHWDWQQPVHNEVHIDIVGGNSFPQGDNRLALLAWDANGSADDWLFDTVDLSDIIRMGDVCRSVYWKSGGRHYVKLNVYRRGSLVISRMASKDVTVAEDLGILKQLTLGNTHMLMSQGQTHSANGIFQHISVEEAPLGQTAVDTFLASGVRPQNANSVLWWDPSLGERVYVRPR